MANLPFATIDSDSRALGKPPMSQLDRELVSFANVRFGDAARGRWMTAKGAKRNG